MKCFMKVLGVAMTAVAGSTAMVSAQEGIADNKAYVQGFIGAVVDGSIDATVDGFGGSVDTGTGLAVGGAFGYGFADTGVLPGTVRTEVEVSYRQSALDVGGFEIDFDNVTGLGNLWFDLPFDDNIVPYAGGGIGIGHVSAEGEGETGLAWQVGGGVNFKVTPEIFAGVAYRYGSTSVDTDVPGVSDTSLNTHQVTANVGFPLN